MSLDFYFAPFVPATDAGDDYFALPAGCDRAIDLRSLSDQNRPGMALVSCPEGTSPPEQSVHIGRGNAPRFVTLGVKELRRFREAIRFRPKADNLHSAIVDLLIRGADPTGGDAVRPLMPKVNGGFEVITPGINKRGRRVGWTEAAGNIHHKNGRWNKGRRARWNRIRDALWHDYREEAKRNGGNVSQLMLKKRDMLREKFRRGKRNETKWTELIPPEMREGHPDLIPHATTHTDNFNRADSTNLGSDWDETPYGLSSSSSNAKISNNRLTGDTATAFLALYQNAVSGDDHYAQFNTISHSSGNVVAVWTRCLDLSTNTGYWQRSLNNYFGTTGYELRKKIAPAGSTQIASNSTSPSTGVFAGQCDGSTISAELDGVQKISTTDTSITGYLYAAIHNTLNSVVDDWEFGDLGASDIAWSIGVTE